MADGARHQPGACRRWSTGQQFVLQPGRLAPGGWRFDFHKHLAADSQPFDVVARPDGGLG
jgi:hypothetical protein